MCCARIGEGVSLRFYPCVETWVPLVDVPLLRVVAPLWGLSTPQPLLNEVLYRSKSGFTVPAREWLLQASAGGNAERGLRGWARTAYDSRGSNT
jgi:hypothetical protein